MNDDQAVQYLQTLRPGDLPPAIFHAIAALTVTPIYEVVPVRRNAQNVVEVLLLERPATDPVWGGMLHTPGTVIRANDDEGELTSASERIRAELGGAEFRSQPVFVEQRFHQVKRGRELALVYWAELRDDVRVGQWYSAESLPTLLVETQRGFIQSAVHHYQTHSR